MKYEKKQSIKMDFKNCEMRMVDDRLIIIEYNKDNEPIDEFDLLDELENRNGFLNEIGFNITIGRSISE